MYCTFCGRELRNDEGCCCCKAVAVRNGEPGFVVTRSLIKSADPLAYNHKHDGVSYRQDQHGKYSSYNTSGRSQINPGNSRSYTTGQNKNTVGNKNSGNSNRKKQTKGNSASGIFFFIFICIIYFILKS